MFIPFQQALCLYEYWDMRLFGKDLRPEKMNRTATAIYMGRVKSAVTKKVDYDNPIVIADTSAAELCPTIDANGTELLVEYEEDNLDNLPGDDNTGIDRPAAPQNLRILNS
jgi:hypothetical protein